MKSWLIGKDPDAGKDWRREEKGTTEAEMVRMASPTQWTWVWAISGSWWWTGRPGVLQSMGLQRVGHEWATELNWCLKAYKLGSIKSEGKVSMEFGQWWRNEVMEISWHLRPRTTQCKRSGRLDHNLELIVLERTVTGDRIRVNLSLIFGC